jgi:predicted RNA binding protein YcfA (HicA-like mRNA interferase family)
MSNGQRLARALRKLGYEIVRQEGSHMRLTTQTNGQHHQQSPDTSP